jgi:hypothetical protein
MNTNPMTPTPDPTPQAPADWRAEDVALSGTLPPAQPPAATATPGDTRRAEVIRLGRAAFGVWLKENCQCEPEINNCPCCYCAEDAALTEAEKMLAELTALRAERDALAARCKALEEALANRFGQPEVEACLGTRALQKLRSRRKDIDEVNAALASDQAEIDKQEFGPSGHKSTPYQIGYDSAAALAKGATP